jgi:hypothetical protein
MLSQPINLIQRNLLTTHLKLLRTLELGEFSSSHPGPFIPGKGGQEARWALQRYGHNGRPKSNRGHPDRRESLHKLNYPS